MNYISIIIVLSIISFPCGQASCDFPWMHVDSRCYAKSDQAMSYFKADVFCRQIGGHLVEPRAKNVTHDMKRFLDSDKDYWICLSDVAEEGHLRWSSDFTDLTGYTHWYPGEPKNSITSNCVMAIGDHTMEWFL